MERIDPEKIEKAIKQYVKQMGLEQGFKQYRIMKTFNEFAGENIVKHIVKKTLDIEKRKLFIYMDSAVARNELFMKRSNIAKQINESYGEFIVEEIIIN